MIRMRSCMQSSKWLEKLKLHKVFPGHLKGLGSLNYLFFFGTELTFLHVNLGTEYTRT